MEHETLQNKYVNDFICVELLKSMQLSHLPQHGQGAA